MIGPVADALQLAWGYIYWNVRKTRFRLGRGKVPCPCQSPSDSGRAMETRCDPSLLLNQPGRFRHVCPLLKQDAEGRWRCSVDTPDVRPFWLRAFTTFALSLALCYALGAAGVWGLLRWRGYPVSYVDVAWPGAWSRFHVTQSHYFAEKANRALARGDFDEALMSLSVAYERDPTNYTLGRQFARFIQVAQPGLADRVYGRLAHDHPDRLPETLAAWYESLLWRADFKTIVARCREALSIDPAHASAWLNALVFALRREPDINAVRELASATDSAAARVVFSLELQSLTDPASVRSALLKAPPDNAPPYLAFYRPKRLIELGYAQDAITVMNRAPGALPARDQIALRLEAESALGWRSLIRNDCEALLSSSLNVSTAELLSAFFIRHPDAELFGLVFDAFKARPPASLDEAYRAWAGLLCAAGANGDFPRFREAGAQMKKLSGAEYRSLNQVEAFFHGESASSRIESYLPAMQPIPLEVTYALLERYYRPRSQTAARP